MFGANRELEVLVLFPLNQLIQNLTLGLVGPG